MTNAESAFLELAEQHHQRPKLVFDPEILAPDCINEEVQRCLAAHAAAEELMPQLLSEVDKWHSANIEARCRKVIERFLGDFRVRLHWITPQQPLGYHRHGVIDVISVKEEGYAMDVGYGEIGPVTPTAIMENVPVEAGDTYLMLPNFWHELRHGSKDTPSVSLNTKQLISRRTSKSPPLPRSELIEKLEQFNAYYIR